MSEVLLVERRDHVEVWTLNRPAALNAFNKALLLALNEQLERLEGDVDGGPRAVVIAGSGPKALSAGADLKERKGMPAAEVPAFVDLIGGTFDRIARQAIPFVAAVHGYAFGGGMEVALGCDVRVGGPTTVMGLTETRLAIIPGAGGTQRLPRLIGVGRAKDLILSGRRVRGEEAFRIGLLEHFADDGDVLGKALSVAESFATAGPVAVRAAKAAIDGGWDLPMPQALAHERVCYDRTLTTTDRVEALAAFAEKRPPNFQGR